MTDALHKLGLPTAVCQTPVTAAATIAFTEGPAVDADGTLYFSDIVNNRIVRRLADGAVSVFREPSHRTNGQAFDLQGRLVHCEGAEFGPGGGRRLTRTDLRSGKYEILTDRMDAPGPTDALPLGHGGTDGRGSVRYNSPNDVCVDGQGRIYFTDPCYGDRSSMESDVEGVYRVDLNGRVTRILQQPCIERPNGIAVSQDARKLYVVDSCPTVGGNRKIWAFELDAEGNPHGQRLVYDFAPGRGGDGIRLDQTGNLYVAAGVMTPRGPHETNRVPPGVYVLRPDGTLLGRIAVPEDLITNLAFGGSDGCTIYITAGKSVYTTRVSIAGQVAYPKWK
ncbi:MAG: SMP-30/gluconolactonase/LRE family protein [Pirellulales bacterium]